ncbi:MAG: YppG family protein [Patescibacteria group bacterium]|nr:YppG family protein [Patescibacteria group bacterium]
MITKTRKYKKFFLPAIIVGLGIFISSLIIVQAQTENISYPIKELGNCKDEIACRNFCEVKENMIPCVNFAEQHDLISKEEAKQAKRFAKIGEGPGGCQGKDECESYCDDNAHIDECLAFAEKNDLISSDELEEAKKVAKALKEGAQLPGGCKRKSDCENYCDNPDHMEECLAFAEKAGFIPPEELAEAKKAAQAMKSGIKPPGNCRGKKQCDAYCSQAEHMEECFNFAVAAGFIPPEEAENARKIMPLMLKGEMPGGCRGKEQCEAYCADESHTEECANFAIKAGFMKPEEAEMFRKTGGKGPGDCKGKEQCEAFCNNPDNQKICFNFAKEYGLIPAEEIENMKQGMEKMKEGFDMAPPEVKSCLESSMGTEIMEKIRAGTLTPGPQIGEQMKNCFEQFMPKPPEGAPGMPGGPGEGPQGQIMPEGFQRMPPQGEFRGPGGCSSPEECQKYCIEHQEECGIPQNQQMPQNYPPQDYQMPPQEQMQYQYQPPSINVMPPTTGEFAPPPSQ